MPGTKRAPPIYSRGGYRLDRRPGRVNLVITWYDTARSRERSISAGSPDEGEASEALDRLYLQSRGAAPPRLGTLVTEAIADYRVTCTHKASYGAICSRLDAVVDYVAATDPAILCRSIDEEWVERFRKWFAKVPIVSPTGVERERSLSTIEASVAQLAAAINALPGEAARFKAIPSTDVNASPTLRLTIAQLAAMFRYAIAQPERANLARYLRAGVATWARPDALYDISTDPKRRQWFPEANVLALNPHGRRQTKKYRATIPVAQQWRDDLDATEGFYVEVGSIRKAWLAMIEELGIYRRGETGEKLLRRSVSHLARKRIGEERWHQGEIMLGHHKASISDLYALPDPANLGLALSATEAIIDDIEHRTPGAFTAFLPRNKTATPKSGD